LIAGVAGLKDAAMQKRSIAIRGHRTSIRLEPDFWLALDNAARRRNVTLAVLIAEIDGKRLKDNPAPALASALRVFALSEASGVRNESE
jgi:predicted DNA-binding ribbon-helix-helix protein